MPEKYILTATEFQDLLRVHEKLHLTVDIYDAGVPRHRLLCRIHVPGYPFVRYTDVQDALERGQLACLDERNQIFGLPR